MACLFPRARTNRQLGADRDISQTPDRRPRGHDQRALPRLAVLLRFGLVSGCSPVVLGSQLTTLPTPPADLHNSAKPPAYAAAAPTKAFVCGWR